MVSKELKDYVNNAQRLGNEKPTLEIVSALRQAASIAYETHRDFNYARKVNLLARTFCEQIIAEQTGADVFKLLDYCRENNVSYDIVDEWYKIVLDLARNMHFDSYMLYLEKNREPNKRFYLNRRKQFIKIGLIQYMQDLIEDKYDILTYSMPPGVGKSTVEKFFITAVMAWYPNDFNIFYSYSDSIARRFYDGVVDIMTSDEYCYAEIFTQKEQQLSSTNAKEHTINVGRFKAFPSLQCVSMEAGNAGRIRANRFLLCDDLIAGIEEAMSAKRLDDKWTKYAIDGRQRKIDTCKEIHIATRWSVNDIIGRLIRKYDGNPRFMALAVPDIDETTGESNFDFEFEGFSTQFFNDQEAIMDEVSYRCLYKNKPIEREGLLYHREDIREYLDLPPNDPDAVLAVCDTKEKGTDFMVMPIFYQYGQNYYLVDCICDNSVDFAVQYNRLTQKIVKYKVQMVEFESNQGGQRIAYEIRRRLKEMDYACNITTRPTETNKETRIIVNSEWIKLHVLFRDESLIERKSDYDVFMKQLFGWSQAAKNEHDDVPDALANFVKFVEKTFSGARVEAIQNPLRYL